MDQVPIYGDPVESGKTAEKVFKNVWETPWDATLKESFHDLFDNNSNNNNSNNNNNNNNTLFALYLITNIKER